LAFEEKTNDAYIPRLWIFSDTNGDRWVPMGWEGGIAWEKFE
jgi:hypothetical protein